MKDPYSILNISTTATEEEIKSAYRRIAMETHPDKNGGDPHKTQLFRDATDAYHFLLNKAQREAYDYYRNTQNESYSESYYEDKTNENKAQSAQTERDLHNAYMEAEDSLHDMRFNILVGLGSLALGAIATWMSYSMSASSGAGSYKVYTGLILVGVIGILKGLFGAVSALRRMANIKEEQKRIFGSGEKYSQRKSSEGTHNKTSEKANTTSTNPNHKTESRNSDFDKNDGVKYKKGTNDNEIKYCQKCGHKVDFDAIFCDKCGSRIEMGNSSMYCKYCGKEVNSESVFCKYCGRKIGTSAKSEENNSDYAESTKNSPNWNYNYKGVKDETMDDIYESFLEQFTDLLNSKNLDLETADISVPLFLSILDYTASYANITQRKKIKRYQDNIQRNVSVLAWHNICGIKAKFDRVVKESIYNEASGITIEEINKKSMYEELSYLAIFVVTTLLVYNNKSIDSFEHEQLVNTANSIVELSYDLFKKIMQASRNKTL